MARGSCTVGGDGGWSARSPCLPEMRVPPPFSLFLPFPGHLGTDAAFPWRLLLAQKPALGGAAGGTVQFSHSVPLVMLVALP